MHLHHYMYQLCRSLSRTHLSLSSAIRTHTLFKVKSSHFLVFPGLYKLLPLPLAAGIQALPTPFSRRLVRFRKMTGFSTSSSTNFAGPLLLAFSALLLLQLAPLKVNAADADPLQDFCVGDLTKDLYINGFPCKNPAAATTDDFVFHGLTVPPQTNNSIGASAVFGFVDNFPGLNSLGIAIARLDFAKGGLIPPHTHPRASEIIYVVEGSLYAGFVTTHNKLFAKVIRKGDVMIFPRGLIHFQLNVGDAPAQAVVSLNSQYPGFQLIANSMFGSQIKDEVLEKTFFLDQKTVDKLKAVFS